MSIDNATITKIASLARIRLDERDKPVFAKELSGILQWVEQLAAVPTQGVELVTSVSGAALPWRKDEVSDGHVRDAVLNNAPAKEYGCFAVPKVIE